MDIKLDENSMRELVSKTIFESMTPEDRDAMMKKAIQGLLVVDQKDGYYGTKKVNLIEQFFKEGIERAARKHIEEKLNTDEDFIANVESLYADVAKKLFGTEIREKMITCIADNIMKNFSPRDY